LNRQRNRGGDWFIGCGLSFDLGVEGIDVVDNRKSVAWDCEAVVVNVNTWQNIGAIESAGAVVWQRIGAKRIDIVDDV
jgi:hypothetical protein